MPVTAAVSPTMFQTIWDSVRHSLTVHGIQQSGRKKLVQSMGKATAAFVLQMFCSMRSIAGYSWHSPIVRRTYHGGVIVETERASQLADLP